jgi:hypothetical protein
MTNMKSILTALLLASAAAIPMSAGTFASANAATAEDLNKDASQALETLYKTNPIAQQISKSARAVLVFPRSIRLPRCPSRSI